ncbi:citrate lyase holo-[acyl-carrier protein] synthase [Erwinia sp. JUb26]|uniref:citrate lyase holo-[acyl-carrier protein] synthase n=1 Tax=Erwinia sp. JUb26 TaxID=2485126 RepID=UPI000F4A25E9|nr:citrate lyase holo-[acyl-carrier protein] synthase [Erwinia sp. JUb26]ROR14737.1 holo-ACP synthase [Erwinia sp. JUb26]
MPLYITSATRAVITVEQLLASRDARRARQQEWLAQDASTLISFTVLVPGSVKDSPLTRRIFNRGVRALRPLLAASGWEITRQRCVALPSGPEGLLAVSVPADRLKRALIDLEQASPLGRLWDFDVLTPQGAILSRKDYNLPARTCLLCQQEASVCARNRAHPLTDLLRQMDALLQMTDAVNPH